MFDSSDPRYLNPAREAIRCAVERGRIVEINTGAMSRGYRSAPYPDAVLLRDLHDLGGRITISSDGCGSQPRFNEKGECVGLDYTSPKVLLIELKNCVFKEEIPLETALGFLTANPARVIGKAGVKGCLQAGADADLIVLNEDLDIVHVMAKGVHACDQGKAILKGRFER